jgi:uncharacterized repeat protein (TIGR01451 family)
VAVISLTVLAAPGALGATLTVTRHLPTVPSLTISVTDGRTSVRTGDRLGYTVRVTDGGAAAARKLKITLMLPSYLRFLSASRGARPANGKVTWLVSLKPGQAAELGLRAVLKRTPRGLARLAAVACADGSNGRAIVCAAHLDALPGNSPVKAAGNTGSPAVRAARPASGLATKVIVAVTALAVLLALMAFAARRSRLRRQPLRHRHSA